MQTEPWYGFCHLMARINRQERQIATLVQSNADLEDRRARLEVGCLLAAMQLRDLQARLEATPPD
jgi:hypothetical protein